MPKIKQIQANWKGGIDVFKLLKEKTTLLEDIKIDIFKASDAINELEGPTLIKGSMLIWPNEL